MKTEIITSVDHIPYAGKLNGNHGLFFCLGWS